MLNRAKLDELRKANGIDTESDLARIIGVDPATLWRLSRGAAVSGSFIARVKLAFPHVPMDQMFSVVTTEKVA